MLPIRKILHATDFSTAAQPGLKAAVELALHHKADLLLVHVIADLPSLSGTFSMFGAHAVEVVERLQQDARRQMEEMVASSIPPELRCDARVIQGQPASAIVRLAKEERIDLIVLTTHGYSGFNRLLFGSVAERVWRTAHCPVLTIRSPEAAE